MDSVPHKRTWAAKFRDAFRGVRQGMASEVSFLVHGAAAAAVVASGAMLGVSPTEWCLLVLCISGVLAAELFNCAIESLARAVDQEHNAALGAALDMASGAVLVTAAGAATVGMIVLLPHLRALLA